MNQEHPIDPVDDDSIVIKIPKSAWQKSAAAPTMQGSPFAAHKAEILQRTGLSVVIGQRNSDYGLTDVGAQRIWRTMNSDYKCLSCCAILPSTANFPVCEITRLNWGGSTDAELRYFAALAAAELAAVLPFSELKEELTITRWAKYGSPIVNRSAALALSRIVRDDRHKDTYLVPRSTGLMCASTT